ncbi:hypothetical protein GCM10020256_39000 [Streptomyces thermocoprophilus]
MAVPAQVHGGRPQAWQAVPYGLPVECGAVGAVPEEDVGAVPSVVEDGEAGEVPFHRHTPAPFAIRSSSSGVPAVIVRTSPTNPSTPVPPTGRPARLGSPPGQGRSPWTTPDRP